MWWVKNPNRERENARSRRPLLNITTPFDFLHYIRSTPICSKRTSIPPNPHHFPHRNILYQTAHEIQFLVRDILYFYRTSSQCNRKQYFHFHSCQFFRQIWYLICHYILELLLYKFNVNELT